MIIIFKRNLEGVVRAAIALKTYPGATLVCIRNDKELEYKLSLYPGEMTAKVESIVRNIPFNVKMSLWERPPKCGQVMRPPSLATYINYSLRHRKCDPIELVKLLSSYYPDMTIALSCKDCPSRKFFHLHREVMYEVERVKSYTRFKESNGIMYAEIYPEHDIRDLYMEWVSKRNDDRATIVKCHIDYYLINARYLGYDRNKAEISHDEVKKLLGSISQCDNNIWEIFYDSQSIENRRNKDYAKRKVPVKFSCLNPEIRKERKKIEHGISHNTLNDFFS